MTFVVLLKADATSNSAVGEACRAFAVGSVTHPFLKLKETIPLLSPPHALSCPSRPAQGPPLGGDLAPFRVFVAREKTHFGKARSLGAINGTNRSLKNSENHLFGAVAVFDSLTAEGQQLGWGRRSQSAATTSFSATC